MVSRSVDAKEVLRAQRAEARRAEREAAEAKTLARADLRDRVLKLRIYLAGQCDVMSTDGRPESDMAAIRELQATVNELIRITDNRENQ